MAVAIAMVLLITGVTIVVCPNNACGQTNRDQNKITDYSTFSSEAGPVWNRVITATQEGQQTLGILQSFIGTMRSKDVSLSDQQVKIMNDNINTANPLINNWNSEKQDLMNKLSDIESRTDYSAMSGTDATKARGDIIEIRARVNQLDSVMSQLKDTVNIATNTRDM